MVSWPRGGERPGTRLPTSTPTSIGALLDTVATQLGNEKPADSCSADLASTKSPVKVTLTCGEPPMKAQNVTSMLVRVARSAGSRVRFTASDTVTCTACAEPAPSASQICAAVSEKSLPIGKGPGLRLARG